MTTVTSPSGGHKASASTLVGSISMPADPGRTLTGGGRGGSLGWDARSGT